MDKELNELNKRLEQKEADEELDDGDERWDPDSDMDVDDERKPLPGRVKKETVETEVKDQESQKGNAENARGYDAIVNEITSLKAIDTGINAMAIDEPSVKVEQETSNKPADQI